MEDVKDACLEIEVLLREMIISHFETLRTEATTLLSSAQRPSIVLDAGMMGCLPAVSSAGCEIHFVDERY